MKKKPPRDAEPPGPGWSSKTAICQLFGGISLANLDKTYLRHVAPEYIRREGRHVWVYLRAIIDGVAAFRAERAAARNGDGMVAAAGTSPALEEFRRWRARRERLAAEKEAGLLVYFEGIRDAMSRFLYQIRDGCSRLQGDSFETMDQVIQEAIDGTRRYFEAAQVRADGGDAPDDTSLDAGGAPRAHAKGAAAEEG